MSDKVTCKMSDGSEWEIIESYPCIQYSTGLKIFHLKPIKREPREFVVPTVNGNPICPSCAHSLPRTQGQAATYGHWVSLVHMREVINE